MEAFGMAMGPCAMMDLAGLDVGWRIRKRRGRRLGVRDSIVADRLCEIGRFGQKTGGGFYHYAAGSRTPVPDPAVERLIVEVSAAAGIERRSIPDEAIVERLVFALVNEGARVLADKIAIRSSDIDVVYVHGYGFPVHRGGPMFHADQVGLASVLEAVERLHAEHGDLWQPAPLLARLAAENGRFGGA
jgi:3-hydroxyacyl-CoA dehydrogenase